MRGWRIRVVKEGTQEIKSYVIFFKSELMDKKKIKGNKTKNTIVSMKSAKKTQGHIDIRYAKC